MSKDDAISHAGLLDLANAIESDDSGYWTNKRISSALRNISSVTQKPIECEDAISREAVNALYDKWRPRLATHVSEFGDELKSLPSVQPKPIECDDAVSRQAILDGIEELKKSPWATDKRGNGFEYLITEALDVVKDLCVKHLPSVTPKLAECDDAISRAYIEPIIEELENICVNADEYILNLLADIKNAPPVTHKSGKWIDYSDEGYVECPFCGHATNCEDDIDELHYCFYCGAKMESEE